MGYFEFRAGGMMGAGPKACSWGSGDERWVQWSCDHWGVFAPVLKISPTWPNALHRSHFGSRYTLGCCGHASLLAMIGVFKSHVCPLHLCL